MEININHYYVDKKARKLLKLILAKLESMSNNDEQEIAALIQKIDAIIAQLKKTV